MITAQEKTLPEKSKQNTLCYINQWCSRVEYRRAQLTSSLHPLPDELHEMNDNELNYWVPRFILDVRKRDSTYYPPVRGGCVQKSSWGCEGSKQALKVVQYYKSLLLLCLLSQAIIITPSSLSYNRPEHAFYLHANPAQTCWFSRTPIGHGSLGEIDMQTG